MDQYTIKKFEGSNNLILRNQNLYSLYIPRSDMENSISGDEIGNICSFDDLDFINHAEDGKEYAKFRKYFVLGEVESALRHIQETVEFLTGVFGKGYEFNYLIVVLNFIEDLFDECELEELSLYDDFDRHKGHVKFYTSHIRLKANNVLSLRSKVSYASAEVLDRI